MCFTKIGDIIYAWEQFAEAGTRGILQLKEGAKAEKVGSFHVQYQTRRLAAERRNKPMSKITAEHRRRKYVNLACFLPLKEQLFCCL